LIRRPHAHRAVVALLTALACPRSGATDLTPPDPQSYVRWGPVRARPGLELTNIGYDDNILSSSTARVSDYTATLSPRLDGLVLFGQPAFMTFREKLEYTSYLHHGDQSFWNQKGAARFVLPLHGIGCFAEVRLDRLRERPIDQDDLRPKRDEDEWRVGAVLEPGWRSEIEASQAHVRFRYSDPDADPATSPTIGQRLDRSEDTTRLSARYLVLGRTRLTLDGEIQTIDFSSAFAADRSADAWSLAPGIELSGGRLEGTARVGWREIDARGATLADFADVVARARLTYRPGASTRLELDLDREPGFAIEGTSVFYLDTRADGRVVRYLSRLLGVEIAGGLERLTFPGGTPSIDRVDHLSRAEVGLRVRLFENTIGRRVEYTFRVRREHRDSTDDAQDRSRTTVGLGAILGF
jgi:hypothetical protein